MMKWRSHSVRGVYEPWGSTKESILGRLETAGYKIVDFRPPTPDDFFIGTGLFSDIYTPGGNKYIPPNKPRLIVERLPT